MTNTAIEIRLSAVRAHSLLGIGNRLHQPRRRNFNNVKPDFRTVNDNALVRIAVKEMDDTIGENALVSRRLNFGAILRLPIISADLQKQMYRMKDIAKAEMEMNAIVAERRVSTALNENVPRYADSIFRIGDRTLVYTKSQNMRTGLSVVSHVDERMVTVKIIDGSHKFLCDSFQLKPFYDEFTNHNSFVNCLTEVILKKDSLEKLSSKLKRDA